MKPIYLILVFYIFTACGNTEKNTNTTNASESDFIVISEKQFKNEQMQLGTLSLQDFNHVIKASGMIDVPPHNKASVSTFLGGYITKTPLLVGDKVKKGQLLVSLQNPEYVELQQQYLEISEQLNYLKTEYNRQKTLFNEQITSQKNYIKAESDYKSHLALYNGLHKKLSMLNISTAQVEKGQLTSSINLYAPIDGFVTKVNISNGSYVSPEDVIIEIVDTNHIHIELSVYEKDILNVKKGQKISFKIPEASKNTFDAEVHLVGTTIDEKTRIVKVHAHILHDDQTNFIVGMFTEASIITNTSKKMALPNDALIENEDKNVALILVKKENGNYYFKKEALEIGEQTETYSNILNTKNVLNKDVLIKGGYMLLN